MILQLLGALLSLFPFSFLAFLTSERILMTHQSRVGMGESQGAFYLQGWVNLKSQLLKHSTLGLIILLAIQFSLLSLIPFFNPSDEMHPLFGGFVVCLVLNLVALMFQGFEADRPEDRINQDQRMVQTMMGSLLALICAYSVFSISGSWSFSEILNQQMPSPFHWGIFWSPVQFVFFILFQIAGMLIFDEHPFLSSFSNQGKDNSFLSSSWIQSGRFYVWSMLAALLFFGGETFFGDWGGALAFLILQLKSTLIYCFFRLVSLYIPRHSTAETVKVTMLFLIPIALAALIFVFMFHGAFLLGGAHV